MEYIKCNLCGSDESIPLRMETKIVSLKPPLALVKCKNCGLIYLNPRPSGKEIRDIYKTSDYFSQYGMIKTYPVVDYSKKRLIQIENGKLSARTILDVGCGTGHFLNYAHSRGWDTYGVDISSWAGKHIKKRFNLKIFIGKLEEANFKSNFFDVVHMSHVLEHIKNPSAVLKEVHRILKQEGILIIEVPNEFNNLLYKLRLFIKRPSYYKITSPHLFFFSPATLIQIIQKVNFKVTKFYTRNSEGTESKYFGGVLAKRLIFLLERWFNMGDTMEIWAIKK